MENVRLAANSKSVMCGIYMHNNQLYPIVASTDLRNGNGLIGWVAANTEVQAGKAFPVCIEVGNKLEVLSVPPVTTCQSYNDVLNAEAQLLATIRKLGCDGVFFANGLQYRINGDKIISYDSGDAVYAKYDNPIDLGLFIDNEGIPIEVINNNKENYRRVSEMLDVIVCGVYKKDGIASDIICDPELGDVVIQFDDLGDILLENVIVTNPRLVDNLDLDALLDFYKADGIFGTTTEWVVITGNTVKFYPYKTPTTAVREVETSFDISYEDTDI